MEETNMQQKPAKKKKKKIPTAGKVIIALLILLVIVLIVFFIVAKKQTNPDNLADRYISAFMAKDTNSLFEILAFDESDFLTPDKFKQSLEECHKFSTLSTYGLTKYEDSKEKYQYHIEYWNNTHGNPYTQDLILTPGEKKDFLFFPHWEIDTAEFLAKNCYIQAPKDAAVSLDGIALNASGEGSESGTMKFSIGNLFIGEHTVEVSVDGFDSFQTTVNLSAKDYSDQAIYSITSSMLKASEKTKQQLASVAQNFVRAIYTYGLEEEDFNKLAEKFPFEDSTKETCRQAYSTLIQNNIQSQNHLNGVTFNTFENDITSTYAEDGCYALNVKTNVEYTASSAIVTSADSGEQLRSTNGSSLFTTTFHYQNGGWVINTSTALDSCIYYIKS